MKYTECSKCNKMITNPNYTKHFKSCGNKISKLDYYKKIGDEYECPYCHQLFSNSSISNHIGYSHEGRKMVRSKESIEKQKRHPNNGGCRQGSGRGKSGYYKGVWCDSSWELAWVIYHLDNNIKFERNKIGFDYIYEGKVSKYYPDFIMEDGVYVEIKGYASPKWKCKINQFSKDIVVLYDKDIKPIIDYVINHYGNDFVSLYDGYSKPEKVREKSQHIINIEKIRTDRINKILNSSVDFSKFGWAKNVSELTGITQQKVTQFVRKYIPSLYENCFKTKKIK